MDLNHLQKIYILQLPCLVGNFFKMTLCTPLHQKFQICGEHKKKILETTCTSQILHVTLYVKFMRKRCYTEEENLSM